MHVGDGLCEPTEMVDVVEDCGYFTPSGYIDLWAESITWIGNSMAFCNIPPSSGAPPVKHFNVS